MRTASIRELQHNLAEVLRYLEHGDEVLITRRNKVVARLLPAEKREEKPQWPDFSERAKQIFPAGGGKPLSEEIYRDREDHP